MITSDEMQELERRAIESGTSEETLMERAGRGAAHVVQQEYSFDSVLLFAGGGNNAGDGFVLARYLDCPVSVIRLKELDDLPQNQFEQVDWTPADCTADMIIDAMLGTGIEGSLREPIASAVPFFNALEAEKVALDVPTGLHPDTGEGNVYCDADLTLCFHDRKPGVPDPVEIVDIGLA
ncbi:MAG: NAD(P)H-hydrate epimerase [Halobacteriaceae archaeon]